MCVSRSESTSFAEITTSSISVEMYGATMDTSSLILGNMNIQCELALTCMAATCVSCCHGDRVGK